MEQEEARQKVHEFLRKVRRYKRWYYRKPAIERLVSLFEQEGVKAVVANDSVSLERQLENCTLRVVFLRDGTIRREIRDKKGVLAILVSGSLKDYLVELLTGASLATS